MNNTFFVFKTGDLPIYSQVGAVYMPVLEILLLSCFFIFTKFSWKKVILTAIFVVCWTILVVVQSVWDVYQILEWLSIAMWSVEMFPQVLYYCN